MAMYKFLERQVGQYMTRNPRSVSSSLTLGELEALFESHDFNAFPVVDGGKLVGLVTKFDFLKAFAFAPTQMVPHYDELMKKTVADVMSRADRKSTL